MIYSKQVRGTSLVELLIAGVIIFLVLVSTTNLVIACLKFFRDTDGAVKAHDSALNSITLIERELRESSASSFQIYSAPDGVVFASPRLPDNTIAFDTTTFQPLWQKWVCFYLEPDGSEFRLIRKEEYFPVGSISDSPPAPDPAKNTAYFQSSVNTGGVVTRGISKIDWIPGPPLQIVLNSRDVSHAGTNSESEFEVEVSTSVSFRN